MQGNWQRPTKTPRRKAAPKDVLSMSCPIHLWDTLGILSLRGKLGENRFKRLMKPKVISRIAPRRPMKCGVLNKWRTLRRPRPIRKYAEKIPTTYMPPICNIFLRPICMPKRKAMVIRRIENEQGCTLSSNAEMRTIGKRRVPSPLKFQTKVLTPGRYLRSKIPPIARLITEIETINLFILWSYH